MKQCKRSIVYMTIEEFIKFLVPKNRKFIDNSCIVTVSQDLNVKDKKNKQIVNAEVLLPPSYIIQEALDNGIKKQYKKLYKEYLEADENRVLFCSLVSLLTAKNMNIIFVTTDAENEFEFFPLISKFLKKNYNVTMYSYDEFKKILKDTEKYPKSIKNIKSTTEILTTQIQIVRSIGSKGYGMSNPYIIAKKINKNMGSDKKLK